MKIKTRLIALIGGGSNYSDIASRPLVREEMYFEDICCDGMNKALRAQETPLADYNSKTTWSSCPFCQKPIEYCE